MHQNVKQFTWRNVTLKRASRLDFWLVDSAISNRTLSSDIRPAIRADHNAISLKIRFKNVKRGPGYWKMNTSILNNKDSQNRTIELIQKISKMQLSPIDKWELLKIKVREFSQKYCRKKSKITKDIKLSLEKKLCSLQKEIDCNIDKNDLLNELTNVKEKLEKYTRLKRKVRELEPA